KRFVDFPGKSVERPWIEVDPLKAERLRDRSANRASIAECRGLDRRRDQMPVRDRGAFVCDQGRKILVSDRRRHQRGADRTEPEAGRTTLARYSDTRRSHCLSRQHAPNTRLAPRTWLRKRHRSGANATVLVIVGLTLRRR